jgi:23S rRNA pseudouridine2605 synthase
MRLQKFLARAGIASRRASERLIDQGRVRVDGAPVVEHGVQVDPGRTVVEVDGRRVVMPPARWLMLNKPPAYISSRRDPQGRRTVYELLPDDATGLFHVGRLDYMSEGLLLFTNEGELAQSLLHPSRETLRRYEVTLADPVPRDLVPRLLAGLELEDGLARAETARVLRGDGSSPAVLELSLKEGRKREIRRMLRAVDVRISRLRRVAFGPIKLGALPPRRWRELTRREVAKLRRSSERKSQ